MWAEGKRDRLRELRLKPMQRHVFLYERGVVLCKRVGKDPDKATYQFKHVLKVNRIRKSFRNGDGCWQFQQRPAIAPVLYRSFVVVGEMKAKYHLSPFE